MTYTVPPRNEIPVEFTWDVESVFEDESQWEAAIQEVTQRLPEVERFKGRLTEGPDVVAQALEAAYSLAGLTAKVFVYASMLHDADTTDQASTAKDDRALALYSQFNTAASFLQPELLQIDAAQLRSWSETDPRLRVYRHFFDRMESKRDHVRSTEVEELLGMVDNAFMTARQIHGTLADADLTFTPATSSSGDHIDVSQGNIDALLSDADREVRRTAWESYADAHLAHKNTMAACLSTGVKQRVFLARSRSYSSCLEAALATHDVPVEVFYSLIDTFRRHLPTWQRYWRIRREALGLESFHEYDIKAPLSVDPPKVTYDEAKDWIIEGMSPLGSEYVSVLQQGLSQRWVDVYPNQGKRAGAFSGGWQGTHPFILMSFTDDVFSMSTLAHELGHSLHSYFSWQNQPPVYADYSTFVAEVASNFNQAMVRHHLFETKPERDFQIALIEEAMSNFHRYFFIMPTLARFELEIHERAERDRPLTAESLIELTGGLFREVYGSEVEFDAERIGITWGEFPTHLYMNFYVFQYATGIAAAHALCNRVLEHGEPAARDYIEFLKLGSSRYPLDALRCAGVDMTSPEPVEKAFAFLDQTVERLAALVGPASGVASHVT